MARITVDLVGRKFIDQVHEDDRQTFSDAFSAALDEADGTAAVEVRFRHGSGEWRHLESMCKNLVDNPDKVKINPNDPPDLDPELLK